MLSNGGTGLGSEDDLASKLNDPARMGGLNLTETGVIGVISDGRTDSRAGERVEPVLVMVEQVKRLSPELERGPFCELEVLAYTHIPVVDSRATQDVAARVAILTIERLAEGNSGQIGGHTACGCGRVWVS